jgi:hypothetical protein
MPRPSGSTGRVSPSPSSGRRTVEDLPLNKIKEGSGQGTAEVKARLESTISDLLQTPLTVMGVCHLTTPGTRID